MSRGLKLYYDFMSQPSRALYIFLSKNRIPFVPCPVALRKFEQKSAEYRNNVNRFGKVPCIVEQDFRLAESVAIYRYLCREYTVEPHWYPANDTVRQARIDEYLSWQHLNLRADVSLYFFHVWLNPLMGKEVDAGKSGRLLERLNRGLDFFEQQLLVNGNQPFLTGETISIADLSAACEIEQAKIAGYDPCVGRPVLSNWMKTVRERTNPFYDEAHKFVYRLAPDHIPKPVVPDVDE
ncbi:glutathione S-transferase theta-1-like [Anopheles nili]|uniref:glutathione S-transferase theta-1-like n=1 Tax=Anopheles nili TaxID=185578 RepID=UPI00237BC11F|nr:glutathione S-transferase theta-1-like [Anopheles nili]